MMMTSDQDDRARDDELERAVRAHFAQARGSSEVPAFETVLARAEAHNAAAGTDAPTGWLLNLIGGWSSGVRWAGGVAATAAVGLAILISLQSEDRLPVEHRVTVVDHAEIRAEAEQQLLASLERTTRWQAPSDRWLSVETDIDLFGLPDIGGAEVLKEESTWL